MRSTKSLSWTRKDTTRDRTFSQWRTNSRTQGVGVGLRDSVMVLEISVLLKILLGVVTTVIGTYCLGLYSRQSLTETLPKRTNVRTEGTPYDLWKDERVRWSMSRNRPLFWGRSGIACRSWWSQRVVCPFDFPTCQISQIPIVDMINRHKKELLYIHQSHF